MRRITPVFALLVLLLASLASAQSAGDWTGIWDTYWRDGEARMTLSQDGETVTGTYEPGNGRIEGRAEGHILTGRWLQDGTSGPVIFALSPDAQSMTGRFVDGEYWNGSRVADASTLQPVFAPPQSPREALQRLVILANNAIHDDDVAAVGAAERMLYYEGPPADTREERRRRGLLWTLIDLSTFRVYDAPARAEGDSATFRIGPAGVNFTHDIAFRRVDGAWFVSVPPEEVLRQTLQDMLAALGFETLADRNAARADSPRATMRNFLLGFRTWHGGGAERSLAELDLSFVPPRLYGFEAPLLAEYLKQVIDRAGYVTWQEIPDDPDRGVPYVFYRHPAGSVVIDRAEGAEDGGGAWVFTAETLRAAPTLFAAMQDLPIVDAVPVSAPVTRFFEIREAIRSLAPRLLWRVGSVELWQWLALPLVAVLGLVLGRMTSAILTGFLGRVLRRAERRLRVTATRRIGAPAGLLVGSSVTVFLFTYVGLAETVLGVLTVILAALVVAAMGWLGYTLVEVIGGYFQRRAERTRGFVDEIATSLVVGLLKVMIVALGIIAIADVTGLPYEGVIAGLGVGGVALAFAARDTVTNLIGGAILMSDRPFRRSDPVETEGVMATVEHVGLRSTRLRTFDDSILIIPNSQLTDKSIVNWGQRRKRKVRLEISLTYDTPRDRLDTFVTRLRDLYLAQPEADVTTGHVGLKSFGASALEVELWGYFNVPDYPMQVAAQHKLIGDIVELAEEIGVSFAFPTRTIRIVSEAEGAPAE